MKIVNFKRHIETGPLRLSVCRLRDLRALYSLFMLEIFQEWTEFKSIPNSLFSFYRWMKNTFQVIYLIEIEEKGKRRIIGFAGLYDMELGRNLRISLTIFDVEDRGRGYGEKALTVLLSLLRENGGAEMVVAEILKSNVPSLRLCRKLGFEVKGSDKDRLLLEKNVQSQKGEKVWSERHCSWSQYWC